MASLQQKEEEGKFELPERKEKGRGDNGLCLLPQKAKKGKGGIVDDRQGRAPGATRDEGKVFLLF